MYLRIFFLGIFFCTLVAAKSQTTVNSQYAIPSGSVATGVKCTGNLNCVITIQDISSYGSGSSITIEPFEHTIPDGWQVVGISGSSAENIKWTIRKTRGMKQHSRITVCMDNRMGGEWKLISTSRCGDCAMMQNTSGTCYLIEKTTLGESENQSNNNSNNNNNNGSQLQKPPITPTSPPPNRGVKFGTPTDNQQGSRGGKIMERAVLIKDVDSAFAALASRRGDRGTNGSSSVIYTGPLPPGADSRNIGTASFYVQYDLGAYTISISGLNMGRIIYYISGQGAPSCGEKGTLNVQMPAGTYEYKAVCTCMVDNKYGKFAFETGGTFTVENQKCTMIDIMGF